MPKLYNIHEPKQILIQFDLLKTENLIYDKENDDYSNWFPCDVKLFVEDKKYDFEYIPTLNLVGLKYFMKNIELLVEEKSWKAKDDTMEYKKFEYFATEGEFIINFRNLEEDDFTVETEVWINMAACKGKSEGYFTGFRFWVSLLELKTFLQKIKGQLYILSEGVEGERYYDEKNQ